MDSTKIIQWNCRGLRSKLDWFKTPVFSNGDILVLQETFLTDAVSISLPGKIIYRLDRVGRSGGGLLIAVNQVFSSSLLHLDASADGNELMGIVVHLGSWKLNIINVYSPSGVVTNDLCNVSKKVSGPMLILGDFNSHHPCWGASARTAHSESFCNWIINENLCIINSTDPTHISPNRSQSLLDLSLCSPDLLAGLRFEVLNDLYDSDHFPIVLDLAKYVPSHGPASFYRWDRISQQVNTDLQDITDIEYDDFIHIITKAMERNTYVNQHSKKKQPPWWTRRCSALSQKKKYLLKESTRSLSEDLWIKYKQVSSTLRRDIKEAKRRFWDSTCRNANDPRLLYKVFKRISNRDSSPPDSHFTLWHNGQIISDPQTQANLFGSHYSNSQQTDPLPIDYGGNENWGLNGPFSLDELKFAVRRTKVSSPGLDKISAAFFKGLNENSLTLLLQIYNKFWSSGLLPEDWRTSVIIPINKPGKEKHCIGSYRPIALTAVIVKICERMIVQRLCNYLTSNNLLDNRLLGFLPFRDSQVAIDLLHINIAAAKKNKKHIMGVALDIQQAYDSVHVDSLIFKCAQLNIRGNMLRWIHQLLNFRLLYVRWRNTLSKAFYNLRGVPQGSVLSPLLFAIYMSDFNEILDCGVDGLVYADDIFLYVFKDSLDSCRTALQFTLQNIARWVRYWKLQIRPDKCSAIVLSRRRGECSDNLSIDGGIIPWSDAIKFLGFMLSRRAGLNRHVEYLRQKAFRRINILKALATHRYGARSIHLVHLVASTIRSLTDYAASTLANCCNTLFDRLEVIQTSALRVALGLPRWTPNILLRKLANFTPIVDRIRSLRARYWIKHRSLGQWSPLNDVFNSSAVHLDDLFAELNCQDEHVMTFTFPIPFDKDRLTIHVDDLDFQDRHLNEGIIRALFHDFMEPLLGQFDCIATDASKSEDVTAIAGISDSENFSYRIPAMNTIFTAEALAICTAFDELIWNRDAVVLLSDSMSVLSALRVCSRSSPKVILRLHNKVARALDRGTKIILCWVPGHCGIRYNELADQLAKSVSSTDICLDWISPEDLSTIIVRNEHSRMEQSFRSSKYYLSHGNIPNIHAIHGWTSNRRLDVLFTRLVSQMLNTPAVLFRFGLVDSEICVCCHVSDNLWHILFKCRKYDRLRACFWCLPGGGIAQFNSFPVFVNALCESAGFRENTIRMLLAMNRF